MRADDIRQVLPVAYQLAAPGSPLEALLEVMEAMHRPVEEALDELDRFVDPRRCPDRFVPHLATWVGLGWLVEQPLPAAGFATGLGRLRELVAQAGQLAELRGTAVGLERFLALVLGEPVTITPSTEPPFHATVTVPAAARTHRQLIHLVVDELKPAHLQVDVVFAQAPPGRAAAEPAAVPPTPAQQEPT